jgi:type II secretory pathway pseudopilin PulG
VSPRARKPFSRLRDQRGFALPTTLAVLTGAFGLASAAAVAAMNTHRGSVRDQASKVALAAADAGLQQALADYNLIPTNATARCLAVGTGGELTHVAPQPDGWCAPVTGRVGAGTYAYQVRHAYGNQLEIVATGTAGTVRRRLEATAAASTGSSVFGSASVIGLDSIALDSNAHIAGNAATNGNVTMASNSSICGQVTHGVGRDILIAGNGRHLCGPELEGPTSLPPVTQGDAATNNSNNRITTGEDLRTGRGITWNPTTRTLQLDSNSTLTLGGQLPYSLCRLVLRSNSSLFVAAGTRARIFFDAPESCPSLTATPAVQLEMNSNSRIAATSGDPTAVSLLFIGSDTRSTRVNLNSNTQVDGDCEHQFVVYAPKTDLSMNSNSVYCGAIAGKSVSMNSNARVVADSRTAGFELPGVAPHYAVERFLECPSQPTTTAPDGGC